MLEKFSVYMTEFEQERTVRVFLPESYSTENKRYPVLYMHDGQNVFEDEGAIDGVSLGLKDYLFDNGLEIIVIGLDLNSEGEERVNEYCPWVNGETAKKVLGYASPTGGKGEAYLDFIIHELKPLIDRKYRTLEHHTSMAGISLGGLISTYAACRYPHVFKRVAAISPGYYRNQEEIESFIKESDLSSMEKFYMDFGTKELKDDEEMNAFFLETISGVYQLLNDKIKDTKFQKIEGGVHDYTDFRKRVPDMMDYLFSDLK